MKFVICNNMDGPRWSCASEISEMKRQILYDCTYMQNLKTKTK